MLWGTLLRSFVLSAWPSLVGFILRGRGRSSFRPQCAQHITPPEDKASESDDSLLKSKETSFSEALHTLSLILIYFDWVMSSL